jgi:molecular chaperone HtpG
MSEMRQTQVDLTGLMKVLGHNLYSTPEVAVRELAQNAHDSCVRRRLDSEDDSFEACITVTADPNAGTLTIVDTGSGLTHDEIIRDLATVGAGATGRARQTYDTTELIGAFGLGFLSAYFIADHVEVHTSSWKSPEEGWRFSSKGGENYLLSPADPRPIGTRVHLTLNVEHRVLAQPGVLAELLGRHCALLPIPIHVGHQGVVNTPPPWRDPDLPAVRWRTLAMEFAGRYERTFAPICVMPIHPSPACDVRGVLWVQDGGTYGTTDNRNVSVFVRGMLVDDNARQLLPTWAGFCGAVIESDALTPTASRESLKKDETYRAVQAHLQEALIEGLTGVERAESAAWRRVVRRHNESLLGAALCDDRLYALLADALKVPTSQGDLPLKTIIRQGKGKVPVSTSDGGHEAVLFGAQQIPVVDGTRYAVLPFCRRGAEKAGATIIQVGTREGERAIFKPEAVDADVRARLEALFGAPGRKLVAARYAPPTLPLVLAPDHEAALKARIEADAADKRISSALLGLARRYTQTIEGGVQARLFVNLDAPLVQALLAEEGPRQTEVARVLNALADLFAAGSAHEVDAAAAFQNMTAGLTTLLG